MNGEKNRRAAGNAQRKKLVTLLAVAVIAVILAFGSRMGWWREDLPQPDPGTQLTEVRTDAPASVDAGTEAEPEKETASETAAAPTEAQTLKYVFYNEKTMNDHFAKHKDDTGCATVEEYLARANAVIEDPDSLHKFEAEDGDDVYYLEATNEIVFVAPRGYIRTYFCPGSGKAYFDKQ